MVYDCIIVGGGPAGSTVASILLRYRPHSRVLILEANAFPRFHTGETLVSELNLILAEMGVYSKVASANFIRKYGATFVWGDDSTPWNMLFGEFHRPSLVAPRVYNRQPPTILTLHYVGPKAPD